MTLVGAPPLSSPAFASWLRSHCPPERKTVLGLGVCVRLCVRACVCRCVCAYACV